LHVRSLNDEATKLIDQTILKDTNEREAILAKQIGNSVTINILKPPTSITGVYIGDVGTYIILQTDANNVTLVNKQNANYYLPHLNASDISLEQTLHWTFKTENRDQLLELSYEFTGGLVWDVQYNLQLNAVENKADFSGMITLENKTKKTFTQVELNLVRVEKIYHHKESRNQIKSMYNNVANSFLKSGNTNSFEEFTRRYSTPKMAFLHDNQTKQIHFVEAHNVAVKRMNLFRGSSEVYKPNQLQLEEHFGRSSTAQVIPVVSFRNTDANGLGMLMPSGNLQILKRAPDDFGLELLGNSTVPHTEPGVELFLPIRNRVKDVDATRKVSDFHHDQKRKTIRESFEIKITNKTKREEEITVLESLYRGKNYAIEFARPQPDKNIVEENLLQWTVKVAPGSETSIVYTASYSF